MTDFDLVADCPWCHKHNTAARTVNRPHHPTVGDVSVCSGCVNIAIFALDEHGQLHLVRPTDGQLHHLRADPHIAEAIARIELANAMVQVDQPASSR